MGFDDNDDRVWTCDRCFAQFGSYEDRHSHTGQCDGHREDVDMLRDSFRRQDEFMEMLRANDVLPEWPIDLTTKSGQRIIKECVHNIMDELFEATQTMRNKVHRLTDDRDFDRAHYREELGDSFAYFLELCILSGIGPNELYEEYVSKNEIVKKRLQAGY